MDSISTYQVLVADHDLELRIKGSKFIAYARHITDRVSAQAHLDAIRTLHPKATHHCSAHTYGLLEQRTEYASDDGEPSGTAGRPILNAIKSSELSECSVVVVRYYGGTKLGTSGLIKAYRGTAKECLETAATIERVVSRNYKLVFGYEKMPQIMSLIDRESMEIVHKDFSAKAVVIIKLPIHSSSTSLEKLYCTIMDLYPSEVEANRLHNWIQSLEV